MSAELQGLTETEYRYPATGGFPTAELAKQTRASFFRLSTVLECFWSFYEAMRQGRPLPQADEKLAVLNRAMHSSKKSL